MSLTLTREECDRVKQKLTKLAQTGAMGELSTLLTTLQSSDVTGKLQNIRDSKIGVVIKKLAEWKDAGVAKQATGIMASWKAVAATKTEVKVSAEKAKAQFEIAQKQADAAKAAEEKLRGAPAAAPPAHVSQASSSANGAGALQLTGNTSRDMARKKLAEAYEVGRINNARYLREADVDTAEMARDTEVAMYEHFNEDTGNLYKARFRSLMFNLKDKSNLEFVRGVIMGSIFVSQLASMDVKEMANAEVKQAREDAKEYAKKSIMDEKSYDSYTGKVQQDGILKCPKCRSMKTEYTEVQTRSADEPTTKKCFCNDCQYRWKFC